MAWSGQTIAHRLQAMQCFMSVTTTGIHPIQFTFSGPAFAMMSTGHAGMQRSHPLQRSSSISM